MVSELSPCFPANAYTGLVSEIERTRRAYVPLYPVKRPTDVVLSVDMAAGNRWAFQQLTFPTDVDAGARQ